MNKLNIVISSFIFLILSTNFSYSNNKVSYLDIDYILANTVAGKILLNNLKKDEQSKIDKFKSSDKNFKDKEKIILAKKNLISKEEITKELNLLQIEFNKYRENKIKEIEDFKSKRNRNILRFLKLLNPIIEKYMEDNSISILMDKKNIFIASKNYDITNNLVELIDNQIKTFDIE